MHHLRHNLLFHELRPLEHERASAFKVTNETTDGRKTRS